MLFKVAFMLAAIGNAFVIANTARDISVSSLGPRQNAGSVAVEGPEELSELCAKIANFGYGCQCKETCTKPTCGSEGAKYARYANPFINDPSNNYATFIPEYFQGQKPLEEGLADTFNIASNPSNTTFVRATQEYQTFLYACQNGTYTFTSSNVDNIVFVWIGDNAKYPTRQNADLSQIYNFDQPRKTVQKVFAPNTYHPIRILWGNGGGPGLLNLQISGPDGAELTGPSNATSRAYLVTQPCDSSENPFLL